MRLLFGHDAEVAHWVAGHIPHMEAPFRELPPGQAFGPCAAIGVVDDEGRIVAGVVYHSYAPHWSSVELSCASVTSRWTSRAIVCALLRYPFEQLNCQRCTSVTPLKSDQPRRFLKGLGFTQEGVARLGFGNDHAVIWGLLAKDWRRHPYNRSRVTHGQEVGPRAAACA